MLTVTAVVVILTLATVQVQHSVQAAHTGSHEHSEHGTVTYVYDPVMHYLVARTHSTCYFMGLDNHQIHQVHQVNGLEQLEYTDDRWVKQLLTSTKQLHVFHGISTTTFSEFVMFRRAKRTQCLLHVDGRSTSK
ncbi:hypothetical protein KP79_PYT21085 [Mizuhopecten yessoensis]|uniref:Uncharacterized protein n=1 Tax=Mizuhopecten yessoensis TaxID=6573 RepID=A0A210Q5T3_MIZYE|nr:hypothetical protein KP79_PYT21085 [Mizuhopecten yessoensis]